MSETSIAKIKSKPRAKSGPEIQSAQELLDHLDYILTRQARELERVLARSRESHEAARQRLGLIFGKYSSVADRLFAMQNRVGALPPEDWDAWAEQYGQLQAEKEALGLIYNDAKATEDREKRQLELDLQAYNQWEAYPVWRRKADYIVDFMRSAALPMRELNKLSEAMDALWKENTSEPWVWPPKEDENRALIVPLQPGWKEV